MSERTDSVIIRAGQNLWQDVAFDISWKAAEEAGLQRGSYWFYDSRVNPKRQAEKWVEVLGSDAGELELWMDFEDRYGGQFGGMKNWYDFAERMKSLLPHKQLGVYTGYYYWMEHLTGIESYFAQYPLWIAAYGTPAPRIPPTWDDWLMWQYTDNGTGSIYGAPSGNIDLNYRKGERKSSIIADFGSQKVQYEQI